jgi:hypothetical protein
MAETNAALCKPPKRRALPFPSQRAGEASLALARSPSFESRNFYFDATSRAVETLVGPSRRTRKTAFGVAKS